MTSDCYTVVGGGAIGGTLAHSLARAGHRVRVIDADAEHVAAIRTHGLVLDQGGNRTAVPVEAATPDTYGGPPLGPVLLAVKAQATDAAMSWIAPRLRDDGYVVSVQNGFNERLVARHVGAERTVAAFVNIFADVTGPGVIRDGGDGALVIGEPDGSPVSERVRALVADLRAWGPATASDNVEGYLWAKAGFGAMLAATALADAPMADLIDRHRCVMYTVAEEIYRVALAQGVRLEPFDAFETEAFVPGADPAARERATDRLTAWLRTMPKDRSGIWRDLAVRRRPVEVTTHYDTVFAEAARAGVRTPVLRAVMAGLRELEADPSTMTETRLEDLGTVAAAGQEDDALPVAAALPPEDARAVRAWLAEHRSDMLADLADYTGLESSSDDTRALDTCLQWLRGWLDGALGRADCEELLPHEEAGDVLIRRYTGANCVPGTRPLLLLAHYDTVWPTGTLAQWPYTQDGDRITGPGVFDMKAGLVQAVWALRALKDLGLPRPPCTLVLNGDEETGSRASSVTIIEEALVSRAALVFEASADGALKTARKGVGLFTLTVHGEEAHAGLDPTAGVSAVEEIAQQIPRLHALRDLDAGTSVNVGVVHGGTRSNVTAGRATAEFDVRVASDAERERIGTALAGLRPVDPRASLEVTGEWNRPVFARTPAVAGLFALARECGRPLGLDLRETSVGGASDGNFVLGAGVPVLDGLGAVGGGAHARSEHVSAAAMPERAALTAGLLAAFATG